MAFFPLRRHLYRQALTLWAHHHPSWRWCFLFRQLRKVSWMSDRTEVSHDVTFLILFWCVCRGSHNGCYLDLYRSVSKTFRVISQKTPPLNPHCLFLISVAEAIFFSFTCPHYAFVAWISLIYMTVVLLMYQSISPPTIPWYFTSFLLCLSQMRTIMLMYNHKILIGVIKY